MHPGEPSGPDLAGVVADARAAGLEHVVIGGFSVIYHGHVRATRDSDLLVPDGTEADDAVLRFPERAEATRVSDGESPTRQDIADERHLRVNSRHGIIDLTRGDLPPLDYDTVAHRAICDQWGDQTVRIADLSSIVAFKRLARRPQDRVDLEELEAIYGELPIEPIPGLDR